MPYIQEHLRGHAFRHPLNAGELNYAVTRRAIDDEDETFDAVRDGVRSIVDSYVTRRGQITYATINEVIGVLCCATSEADRRVPDSGVGDVLSDVAIAWYSEVAADYEDLKCAVNGDVYGAVGG